MPSIERLQRIDKHGASAPDRTAARILKAVTNELEPAPCEHTATSGDPELPVIAPVHMPIMTHEEVVEMVRGGVERARAHCANELERGNYFPGCPVQSRHF
jgi:hypothetical protein